MRVISTERIVWSRVSFPTYIVIRIERGSCMRVIRRVERGVVPELRGLPSSVWAWPH